MREIVLDTETTGLSPEAGHRLVEIGCLELMNHVPTGRYYHTYINPKRDVPAEAFAVHGLSQEFLANHPSFEDIVNDFLTFIANDKLIIHNAAFDMKFLNAELKSFKFSLLDSSRAIDTLLIAREKFPGSPASLDALCKRFNIDRTSRVKHGALVDSELLAKVYLELIGGKQPGLALDTNLVSGSQENVDIKRVEKIKETYPQRIFRVSVEEQALHEKLVQKLKNPLWDEY